MMIKWEDRWDWLRLCEYSNNNDPPFSTPLPDTVL